MNMERLLQRLGDVLTEELQQENKTNAHIEKVLLSYPQDEHWKTWVNMMLHLALLVRSGHPDQKETLSYIYTQMRRVYGFVAEQEIKDYKEENNLYHRKVGTLEVIENDPQWKAIFSAMLIDVVHNEGKEIENAVRADVKKILKEPRQSKKAREEQFDELVQMIAQSRGDTTIGYNATCRQIYKNMGVSWPNRVTRYKNHAGIKYNPKKKVVICASDELFHKFTACAKELQKGVS